MPPVEPDYVPAQTGSFAEEGAYNQATFPSLHAYPSTLPPFLSNGHIFEDIGVAEDFAFEQGEDRSRQTYTFNPQLVSLSTELSQAEFDTFNAWYEGDLHAGGVRFDIQVAGQGGTGLSWWTAQFVEPFKWEAFGWYFVLTAQVLLLDGPYATRTAPGMQGQSTLVFGFAATLAGATELRGLSSLVTTLTGAMPVIPLRGASTLQTTLTGLLLANLGPNGGDIERLWVGLAQTPSAGDEVSRATIENLQRAWLELNNGVY